MKNIEIANCRGKKPVIRDIVKALLVLVNCKSEMNDCRLRRAIDKTAEAFRKILLKDYQQNQKKGRGQNA